MNSGQPAQGRLAVIGGRLELDNAAVFQEMNRLARGRIAVFPTASEIADEVGPDVVRDFRDHGLEAELIPLKWDNRRELAFDTDLIGRVRNIGSVYFTGGDQSRIVGSLIQNDEETPLLKGLRELHASGGLIAGSSAGAAMMSHKIILGGTSLEAMVDGCVNDMDDPGLVLGEGLGFFPWGMVDQHFIQRGRLGRLIVAMQKCGYTYGFGVDENTGMFIDGRLMQVRGETGIMVVDLSQAECRDRDFRGVRISYLDDGDAYDLARHRALPHRSKKRIRVTKSSFSSPAPFQRNAFGAYALHELMIRLMKGNPKKYRKDSASAYDPREEKEVVVEMERLPRRSRALRSTRPDGAHRYTAVNFQINMRTETQTRAERRAVKEDYAARMFESRPPAAEARLIVLGNSPIEWSPENAGSLMEHIREPVGIIASAAADPVTTAREYEEWLRKKGVRDLERFDIVSWNVDRFGRDREVLERLASSRTLIFTGGNQRRLVETLLHRGEATTVLQAIANAYHHGATLMAVSGSASAICTSMIAEGSSHEALLFGASTDAGHEGMVIEEGFGLFKIGIVDQNLISRRRLGRLIVACAEEQSRFGFGLCEESGMVLSEASAPVHAIGQHGFVVAALDPTKTSLGSDSFTAHEVKLCFVQAGESFDPRSGQVIGVREPQLSVSAVERLVTDLARDCDATLHFGASQVRSKLIELRFKPDADGTALLDIETHRVRA